MLGGVNISGRVLVCQIAEFVQQSADDIDTELLEAEWVPKTHSKQVACTIEELPEMEHVFVFCEAIMSNDLLVDDAVAEYCSVNMLVE